MAVKAGNQLALDERLVENAELEELLERRDSKRIARSFLSKEFDDAHKAAVVEIEKLDLGDGAVVRVGRFRIERIEVKPRAVRFESGASTRIQIKPDSDE